MLLLIQGRIKIGGTLFKITQMTMVTSFMNSFTKTIAIEAIKKILNFKKKSLDPSAVLMHCIYI